MNEVEFRQLDIKKEGDIIQFKGLHNVLFKNTNITFEWISWYNQLLKNVRIYGAFSGKLLVGIWCVESRSLVCLQNDSSRNVISMKPVGRCFSVGVHPSFQRRGIFVNLSKFAISKEKEIGEYEYIVGFPQEGRSVIEGHIKAGWEHIQDIDIMSFKPNVVDESASMLKPTKLIKFEEACSIGNFYFDSGYRLNRWLRHPDNHYICLGHRSAHLVAKPYGDSCHILDFDGAIEDVAILLESAKTLAKRHNWKELNSWCAENSRFRNIMKACGFVNGSERGLPIKMLAVKISASEPLTLSECNFQMCVEEPY